MRQSLLVAIVIAAFCFVYVAADCSVTVKQTLGSAWKQDGKDVSQWNSQLTAGSERVKSVQLSITGANITQLWELTLNTSTGLYSLPAYRLQNGGLGAGETHQFGYIWQSAAQATIAVVSIDCGSTPTPSPTGVAGSPSPVAPSPSASPAAASPSPSTIVSTPQPSSAPSGDCSLTVTQTKRSAAEGGSWTTGDYGFQIYDLALANNGQRAATYARLNVAFAAGSQQAIYQFWNVERASADSTVFNVPTPWGAIQVGASQGAGYIVRYPISAANSQADPTITVLSVTCDGSSSGSPAPASPSASPAAPSASASPAAASPSPSTIVSTPQPSASAGCSATVSISARSAANSGSWTANGANFQIFDLQITNTGSKALTAARLTFTLPNGSTVFQWWELMSLANSATVYDVAFNYGPLQAGSTQGAGIVGKSASASQATPTVTIGSLTCA